MCVPCMCVHFLTRQNVWSLCRVTVFPPDCWNLHSETTQYTPCCHGNTNTRYPQINTLLSIASHIPWHHMSSHDITWHYRSLAKKGPFTKERPPPTRGPISCIGSKFIWISAHPGASFAWSLRSTASNAMRISGKKLYVTLHRNIIQGIFV